MPLQAITFDAAGTLIHLQKPVGETYSEIAAKFGIHASPAAIETAFRSVWKRTPAPFSNQQGDKLARQRSEDSCAAEPQDRPDEIGIFNAPTLSVRENHLERDWWKTLVHEVFTQAEAGHGPQFDDFFSELYDHFENPACWQLDPDAVEVLESISARGLKIGLLSNFDYRLRKILTGLEIIHFFEAVVLSGEIHASKPDPRMFATIQQALGLGEPSTILHVGDDPECDIAGAQQFGFQAFRVKSGKIALGELIKHLG